MKKKLQKPILHLQEHNPLNYMRSSHKHAANLQEGNHKVWKKNNWEKKCFGVASRRNVNYSILRSLHYFFKALWRRKAKIEYALVANVKFIFAKVYVAIE